MKKYNENQLLGWDRLEKHIGGAEGRELVLALQDLYELYDDRLVSWFANLYDPKIGGWYYSNSARDNDTVIYKEKEYKLLPDAESTCQALGFWTSTGLVGDADGYADAIPVWMSRQIAAYIYGLQDPDGYFYHPQWGKNISISRRGRDMTWSRNMLEAFGVTPRYKSIVDAPSGDAAANILVPEHLKSKENFAKYLENGNVNERSYHFGSEVSTQSRQIVAMGLMDQCIEFLNSRQHSESGHWHSEDNYYAVNGIMKISGIYSVANKPYPNAGAAAISAIRAIGSDEPVHAVVDLWNTWVAANNLMRNLRVTGGDAGEREVEKIIGELRAIAPEAIRCSKAKMQIFKKDDGAFSYHPKYPSPTSQGAPVAVPYLPEGDINATVIASSLLISMIYSALDLSEYKVPLFGESERKMYVEILEKNNEK